MFLGGSFYERIRLYYHLDTISGPGLTHTEFTFNYI